MLINNYYSLATTELRKNALDILISGIESVMPAEFMKKKISYDKGMLKVENSTFDISKGRLYVIGGGKASAMMAYELEKILGERISKGIIISNTEFNKTRKIRVIKASHPIPDKSCIEGVKDMLKLTGNLKREDTVICLISGGGSALMTYPAEKITIKDITKLTSLLLKSGAEVYEINVIRKRISQIKGGKLARHLQPAKVISLIVSDTLNPKDATASGPTMPDQSTFNTAYSILEKYNLTKKTPASIIAHLKRGMGGLEEETIKENELFKNVHNFILADNQIALKAMEQKAVSLGYTAEVLKDNLIGEAKLAGKRFAELISEKSKSNKKNFALICGGETTVTVTGNGKGGRLQEFVASLIDEIGSLKGCVVAALGSDGIDFIKGIGGAIADDKTSEKAAGLGLKISDFISANNTYALHKKLDSLILTNSTHTNVTDLHLALFSIE